jgi:hypothetical protein
MQSTLSFVGKDKLYNVGQIIYDMSRKSTEDIRFIFYYYVYC